MSNPRGPRVAIIGAGMSGLLASIRLREAGIADVTIHEKADRPGGTWRDNTYPGLSCDVPSHVYTYSFAPNPDWSRRFSPGAEIQAYFEGIADRYGLRSLTRFASEIAELRWEGARWHLRATDGHSEVADYVIAATGVLHRPVMPDIPGLERFAGAAFHSARWNHAVPLDGRRVGIVGTGSTAIQIVPALVDRVRHLSLFQRTAQWVLPIVNDPYSDEEKAGWRADPARHRAMRDWLAARLIDTFARAVVGEDASGLAEIERMCREHLETVVRDPGLRERLRPNYRAACKRLVMSDSFYEAIQKPNAELVTDPIREVELAGVRTADGTLHELDVLVLATGFDGHNFLRPMRVAGEGGRTLDEAWSAGNRAYRSVVVPGFPNLFMPVGPNSPIGNFSVIEISEMQTDYILRLIATAEAAPRRRIAPTERATATFNAAMAARMSGTVWASGCRSWYLDRHGRPALWPWSYERFKADMARPDLADFEVG
ncbi:MAG: NAD(P)/FAD-dependent oxidoreductase [Alphaproteobacteria bacterium]|nr:NAD(P)/FAD-dependent oxidoreductase [Alphaproteobacteria bacterium]